jgi:hypothetical protein
VVFHAGLVLGFLLITVRASAAEARADADDESRLFGDWKGESIVVAKSSVAKDEVVVWHISRAKEPGKVTVTADKIVNGQSITMGTGDWVYDKTKKTITWKSKVGVWKLSVDGNTMKGTLTLPDRTVFRRVSLQRSGSGNRPAN